MHLILSSVQKSVNSEFPKQPIHRTRLSSFSQRVDSTPFFPAPPFPLHIKAHIENTYTSQNLENLPHKSKEASLYTSSRYL